MVRFSSIQKTEKHCFSAEVILLFICKIVICNFMTFLTRLDFFFLMYRLMCLTIVHSKIKREKTNVG